MMWREISLVLTVLLFLAVGFLGSSIKEIERKYEVERKLADEHFSELQECWRARGLIK